MSDFPRTAQHMKREVSAEGGALWRTLYHLWPYIWPSDRSDLKARVLMALGLLLVAKLATIAVPFTFKWATDALVDDPGQPGLGLGDGGAAHHDRGLWRHAHRDGAAHPGARRPVRQGRDERGAPARGAHLRAHAPALAALPSRAQDRRAHPRARARAQRHRDHRADGDPAAHPDHRRGGADLRGAALPVRLALRARSSSSPSRSTSGTPTSRRNGGSASAAR